jgi:hypothetical protein
MAWTTFLFVIKITCESLRRDMDFYFLIPEVNHIWTLLDDLGYTVPFLTNITELKGLGHEIDLKKLDQPKFTHLALKKELGKIFRGSSNLKNKK